MPFSNDEQIPVEENPKLNTIVFFTSLGLFVLSLFNICFCTDNSCRMSIEAFLFGWFAMATDEASMAWMANPFLITAWILFNKNKKLAWVFGLIASVISISFLNDDSIVENEAGHIKPIVTVGLGFWLWLSSCVVAFVGGLLSQVFKVK